MSNKLKELGEMNAWRLMVHAAVMGANQNGYVMKRQPGRGLSNIWEASKDNKTSIIAIRTTKNRSFAFPSLEKGEKWKTLDESDFVIVAAVDDPEKPQRIEIYLFPSDAVRERFRMVYNARIASGYTMRDNYGMWVKLDPPVNDSPMQIGGGLAVEYPAIASFSINDLEKEMSDHDDKSASITLTEEEGFLNVSDVIAWARSEISRLSGMPIGSIKIDLKFEA